MTGENMYIKKYNADLSFIKFLVTEKTKNNDSRVQIFENVWAHAWKKRGTIRIKAREKLKNIVINLVRSLLSYDVAIREVEDRMWHARPLVCLPLVFSGYKITTEPCTVPSDYRITLYHDLEIEALQRGKRGKAATEKMGNLIRNLFYCVNCRKETLRFYKLSL